MRKNKALKLLAILFCFAITNQIAYAEGGEFSVCPLCSNTGEVLCPLGSTAGCINDTPEETIPKCVFYGDRYVAGCWKFIGIKKLDLDFSKLGMPPSLMIDVIGGGETYTLNRETIGCRKL